MVNENHKRGMSIMLSGMTGLSVAAVVVVLLGCGPVEQHGDPAKVAAFEEAQVYCNDKGGLADIKVGSPTRTIRVNCKDGQTELFDFH